MQHAEHDNVYQEAFAMLGTQKAESYESLERVLPSIKDGLAEAKELIAMKVLREMKKPQMDRLRAEYEEAAAQEDADDLSTEEGDWVDASGQLGAAGDEDLDDEGIPVVKLTRPSSSFILDGPGDVKVDNFTPEGEAEAEACTFTVAPGGGASAAAAALSTAPLRTEPPASRFSGAAKAEEALVYVPSAIVRASVGPRHATGTLEDELRAMRAQGTLPGADAAAAAAVDARVRAAAAAAASRPGPLAILPRPSMLPTRAMGPALTNGTNVAGVTDAAARSAAPIASVTADAGRTSTLPPDDEDPEVIIMEAPSAPAPMLVPAPSASGAGGVSTSGLDAGAGGGDDSALTAASTSAGAGNGSEDGSALPGACVDTSAEDAAWVAMQGVDGAALLEHMGLSGEPPQLGSANPESGEDESPAEALENGHAHADEPGRNSDGGDADVPAEAGEARTSGEAAQLAGPPGRSGAGLGSSISTALARHTTASSDGPSYEVVEAFSLDPDFDYDNVELTPREFPYTMLNMRGAGGQVPPGAQQRR